MTYISTWWLTTVEDNRNLITNIRINTNSPPRNVSTLPQVEVNIRNFVETTKQPVMLYVVLPPKKKVV